MAIWSALRFSRVGVPKTGGPHSIKSQPDTPGSLTRGRGSPLSIWSSPDLTNPQTKEDGLLD